MINRLLFAVGSFFVLTASTFADSEKEPYPPSKVSSKLIAPADENDLFPEGRFSDCELDMFPSGWGIAHGVNRNYPNDARIRKDDSGNAYLSIKLGKGQNIMLERSVPLNPAWSKLRLTVKARVPELMPGDEKWKNPSVVVYFYDENGQRINKYPASIIFTQAIKDFTVETREFAVDPNAKQIAIYAGLYGGRGSMDIEYIALNEVKAADQRK